MTDRKYKQITIACALAAIISYFLPWMVAATDNGTIEIKGQFLDYSWTLLLVGIAYLITRYSILNADALGIPDAGVEKLRLAEQVAPLALFAFVIWAGAVFEFRKYSGGGDFEDGARATLGYGYWLAITSAGCLIAATALKTKNYRRFTVFSAAVLAGTVGLAFVTNRPPKAEAAAPTRSPASPSDLRRSPILAAAEESAFDFKPYVSVAAASGKIYPKNVEAERFDDTISIKIKFKNLTDKTITGIRGRVQVLDAFGKEAYSFGFRDNDKIAPHSTESNGSWEFKHNEFEDDDPYSRMVSLIQGDTAKYVVSVTDIAFSDGSVLPKK